MINDLSLRIFFNFRKMFSDRQVSAFLPTLVFSGIEVTTQLLIFLDPRCSF